MERLSIEGGFPLVGTIEVSGSKNAALPLLFASILLDGTSTYTSVPDLRDIRTTVRLLNILGVKAEFFPEKHSVVASPAMLAPEAPYDLVKTMRASVLCLGPLLARLGQAQVAMPGGCAIGARPVDLHLSALEKMGAHFDIDGGYIVGRCQKLIGTHIHFDFPTVGGTENLLMAATLAEGETVLENAAREPEIVDLARFLRSCGAKIQGEGESIIHIQGVKTLHGTEYSVMSDRIEAGTFMAAVGIAGGDVLLKNCPWETLDSTVEKLCAMGMNIEHTQDGVRVQRTSERLSSINVSTRPYPGFPTDMQAQVMATLCLANGTSIIEENIFENRFMHVPELARMGADIHLSGHTAIVQGVSGLKGAPVMASDLRASASLVLAGLAAHGTTIVQRIYHLDRGYERIEEKLNAVGAKIRREQDPSA